jgi:transposase
LVINGILWKLRAGAPWRDLPERYGPWKTCHERLRRWTADGTWDRILEHVVVKDDAVWKVAVDGRGLPMSILVTPGQAGDNPELFPLLDQVSVRSLWGGPPRRRPRRVIADKAYSHPVTRRALRARRIAFTCPERSDQIAYRKNRGPAGGRPPAFDKAIYKQRNVVERCFNRLKQFRGLATRYAKRAAYYRSEVVIATIALWLRDSPDTP